jgi:hypothetical protein
MDRYDFSGDEEDNDDEFDFSGPTSAVNNVENKVVVSSESKDEQEFIESNNL